MVPNLNNELSNDSRRINANIEKTSGFPFIQFIQLATLPRSSMLKFLIQLRTQSNFDRKIMSYASTIVVTLVLLSDCFPPVVQCLNVRL
mgnify:CR=1 FL=1